MTIAEVSKKFGLTQDTLRYYERAGMIPPVHRTSGGLRDYTDEDCKWVSLAKCMRAAGLPVEALSEYVRLFREGDSTFEARLRLLTDQREVLLAQRRQIDETLERLNTKISHYEAARESGKPDWTK